MKSVLSVAVLLRCLQIDCDPSYLLFTCFCIVCYCYGVVRAGFLLWRAWWRKHLMMIRALWQVSHQFIVWYMCPNIDSYCPSVFNVFGYSLEQDLLSGASPSPAMLAGLCQLLLLMNNMPRHCPSIVFILVPNQLCLQSLQQSLLMLLQPLWRNVRKTLRWRLMGRMESRIIIGEPLLCTIYQTIYQRFLFVDSTQ